MATVLGYAVLLPMGYGPFADAASMALALSLAAMAAGVAELTWERAKALTTALATFGVLAALGAAALGAALLGGAGPALVPAVGVAFAAMGAWLLGWDALALATGALPRWAAVAGMLAGAGFLVGGLFPDGDGFGPVAAVAGALTLAGFPAWTWGARGAALRTAHAVVRARPPMVNA